jgi:hypothetical protein
MSNFHGATKPCDMGRKTLGAPYGPVLPPGASKGDREPVEPSPAELVNRLIYESKNMLKKRQGCRYRLEIRRQSGIESVGMYPLIFPARIGQSPAIEDESASVTAFVAWNTLAMVPE